MITESQITSGRGAFVGREREMEVLRMRVHLAMRAEGGIALLSGEAGIGKTRTAEEAAAFARTCGAWVCYIRGWEGHGAPPFWPWAQAIRTYIREHEPLAVMTQMGRRIGDIVRFMPELRELLPDMRLSPISPQLESDEIRFRVFESVVSFLKNAASEQPIVIVFDDLHWADKASLVLLEYLAGEIQKARLLVICTYRDWEFHSRDELARTVAELARHRWIQHINLQRLTASDIGKFVTSVSQEVKVSLIAALYEKTEGNPLFLTELVRLLSTEGRLCGLDRGQQALTIPQTVRGVIQRRLESLSDESRNILEVASVVGREFDFGIVKTVAQAELGSVVLKIDEARAYRIIVEMPDKIGRYRFLHVLIRDTIYEGIESSKCRNLHNAVGSAIEEQYASCLDTYASTLAHHFYQGVLIGCDNKAIFYSLLAAKVAVSSLAYEEATVHYRRALEMLGYHLRDRDARCGILLSLGEALLKGGDWAAARSTFENAGTLAKEIGSSDAFAVAAIGFKGTLSITDPVDEEAVTFLREALREIGPADSRVRSRILSELAMSLYFARHGSEPEKFSDQAVAIARRLEDPVALGIALEARTYSIWRPARSLDVLDCATEIVCLASTEPELRFRGHLFRYEALMQLGRFAESENEWASCRSLSAHLRQPRYLWQTELAASARALAHGRLDESRALSVRSRPFGDLVHKPSAAHYDVLQYFLLSRVSGDLTNVREKLLDGARQYPALRLYRVGLNAVANMTGDIDRVREHLPQIRCWLGDEMREDSFLLLSLILLGEVCAGVRDYNLVAVVYQRLVPYGSSNIVCGRGAACDGSVSHYLGLLANTLERWDDAVRHFEDALEMNRRMNFVPFVARTQHYYAATLLQRGRSDDRDRAISLLSDAMATYLRLGMKGYLREALKVADGVPELARLCAESVDDGSSHECTDLTEDAVEVDVPPADAYPPERIPAPALEAPQENVFRREGEYWTVCYRGRIVRLKNMRGLEYIAFLLSQPGREVHALDLSALINPGSSSTAVRETANVPSKEDRLRIARLSDAGPVLDAKSRSRYRSRLNALGREVTEAEQLNDVLKAAAARREMEMLARELSSGARRGGGSRLAGSYAERARINVRNNISSALRAIRRHDEELWRHLYRGVRTGTYCAYIPEAGVDWQV